MKFVQHVIKSLSKTFARRETWTPSKPGGREDATIPAARKSSTEEWAWAFHIIIFGRRSLWYGDGYREATGTASLKQRQCFVLFRAVPIRGTHQSVTICTLGFFRHGSITFGAKMCVSVCVAHLCGKGSKTIVYLFIRAFASFVASAVDKLLISPRDKWFREVCTLCSLNLWDTSPLPGKAVALEGCFLWSTFFVNF